MGDNSNSSYLAYLNDVFVMGIGQNIFLSQWLLYLYYTTVYTTVCTTILYTYIYIFLSQYQYAYILISVTVLAIGISNLVHIFLSKYVTILVVSMTVTLTCSISMAVLVVGRTHRLISRDRPTKTGRLCMCSPFFYVAALNVRIWRVVDGRWGGTIYV